MKLRSKVKLVIKSILCSYDIIFDLLNIFNYKHQREFKLSLNFFSEDVSETYVAHVERDFQIVDKAIVKLWKQVENVKYVITRNTMQVTICQSSYVAVRFAECRVNAWIFAENIIFS